LLRSSVFDIAGLEFGLVLEVFHGARETTGEPPAGATQACFIGVCRGRPSST
jgi:hypothetical protein